jgi:hypothetical protein
MVSKRKSWKEKLADKKVSLSEGSINGGIRRNTVEARIW